MSAAPDRKVIVANLWAKGLIAGDRITRVDKVDSRYGVLSSFTVERTEEAHNREQKRLAKARGEEE